METSWGTTLEDINEFVGNSWYQGFEAKEIVWKLERYYGLTPEDGYIHVMQWLDDTLRKAERRPDASFITKKINTRIDEYLRTRSRSRELYQDIDKGIVNHAVHSTMAGIAGKIADDLTWNLIEAEAYYAEQEMDKPDVD